MTGGSNLATKWTSGDFGSRVPSISRTPAPFVGDFGGSSVGGGSCQSIGDASGRMFVLAGVSTASDTHSSEILIGG